MKTLLRAIFIVLAVASISYADINWKFWLVSSKPNQEAQPLVFSMTVDQGTLIYSKEGVRKGYAETCKDGNILLHIEYPPWDARVIIVDSGKWRWSQNMLTGEYYLNDGTVGIIIFQTE